MERKRRDQSYVQQRNSAKKAKKKKQKKIIKKITTIAKAKRNYCRILLYQIQHTLSRTSLDTRTSIECAPVTRWTRRDGFGAVILQNASSVGTTTNAQDNASRVHHNFSNQRADTPR
jgi:hypothetical protein